MPAAFIATSSGDRVSGHESKISRRVALLFALTTATVWGTAYVAAKYALRDLPPFTAATARFVIAVAIMALILLASGRAEPIKRRDFPLLVAAGLFQTTFYYALQYTGIGYTTAANTALIVNTRPIWVALLSTFLLKESLGLSRIAGILVAFLGVALLTLGGSDGSFTLDAESALGDFLIVLNALSGALGIITLKKVLGRYSPISTMTYTTAVGAAGLVPLAAYEFWRDGWSPGSAVAWGSVAYMAIFCTVIPYMLWYNALARLRASETAVFLYLTPIISVILSAFLLDEKITGWLVIGGALILAGAYRAISAQEPGILAAKPLA